MDTLELKTFLERDIYTRKYFMGVYPLDRLPRRKLKSLPAIVVFNSEPSTSPGMHWCCLYIKENGVLQFFDSYGMEPKFYGENILCFIKRNSVSIEYSNLRVQEYNSVQCGKFVLFFAFWRSRSLTMERIMDILSENGDETVKMFYDKEMM